MNQLQEQKAYLKDFITRWDKAQDANESLSQLEAEYKARTAELSLPSISADELLHKLEIYGQKVFHYKDKTGRGVKSTKTFAEVLAWETSESYTGEYFDQWIEDCEEGDTWEDAFMLVTCIND